MTKYRTFWRQWRFRIDRHNLQIFTPLAYLWVSIGGYDVVRDVFWTGVEVACKRNPLYASSPFLPVFTKTWRWEPLIP